MLESGRTSRLYCLFDGRGLRIGSLAAFGAYPIVSLCPVLNLDVAARSIRALEESHVVVPKSAKLEERAFIHFLTTQKHESLPGLLDN